jgi:methylamine dehydrogenase accessory protein MauD
MNPDSANRYLKLMMSSILLLMIANLGLFLRMNQLQGEVLAVLQPLQLPKGLDEGIQAPTLSLKSLQGQVVSLQDFKGKEVLLVFSSTTCAACKKFWPTLKQFRQTHPTLDLIMVSRGAPEESQTMAQQENFDFPVLLWDDATAEAYKVPGTPYLVLVSDDQKVALAGFSNDLSRVESMIAK